MSEHEYETGDAAYLTLLQLVRDRGQTTSPRGQETRELQDVTIRLNDPRAAPPAVVRGFNERIAATELIQLLAGVSHLGQLDAASAGAFTRFSDDGRLRGAYGPRLYTQLPEVERRLREDPDTRQAIAVLWRHGEPVTRDVPCTLSLMFRVRDDQLGLKVHMRSNDLMLGVPYDWYVFSRVQLAMAEVLGLEPGPYVHHVDSLHLYERDFARAIRLYRRALTVPRSNQVTTLPRFTTTELQRSEPGVSPPLPFQTWEAVQHAAQRVFWHFPDTEGSWFQDRVAPVDQSEHVCQTCRYIVPRDQMCSDPEGQHCHECCVSTSWHHG